MLRECPPASRSERACVYAAFGSNPIIEILFSGRLSRFEQHGRLTYFRGDEFSALFGERAKS